MSTATTLDLARTARWFHALSDETRLRIVLMLARGERCVCDLQTDLDAAQSRLSFHLKTLKTAGLVTDRKEGRWVHYALNPEVLEAVAAFAGELETDARACCADGPCCG
jgi:ArsR family transcriptional regulator, arsenate/arsenite/antimonite-responsive transcriptional repressor